MDNCKFHIVTENHFENDSPETILVKKNQYLYREGEKIDSIYFLCDGELNILQGGFSLWQAQKNEFVGITSFFGGEENYSSDVKATKNSWLYQIPIERFQETLNNNKTLRLSLVNLFCQRIEKTFNKGEDSIKYTRKKRLINILLKKAEKLSVNEKIVLAYSTQEIAELVNVSNGFAKQFLEELQKKKLLKVLKGKIEITDYRGLKIVSNMKSNGGFL